MSVHAETVLSIDFSTAQGYSDGPLLGQPAGAADVWSEEPGTVPVGFDVQNGKLHFDQHGGANSFIMISFPVTKSGMITATWEWQYLGPADSSVDNGFVLSDSSNFNLDGDDSAIDFNENGAMVRMTAASGMINAVNSDGAGAGTYADVNVDYRDGRVIPMKIEVDLDNFSYDVWADGVLVGDDFGLRRNPQNGFDTLVLWNSGSAVHALEEGMLLDDIVISTETASFVPNWSLFK
ncbi:MAG: hypothetical protein JXR73_03985 [Candidatus Omnitrophica bacterium]|nr:hypothetical protein [Candidatus Omnitrophota bacterium]